MPQDKLTAVRIKQANGSYGPQIPVGAKAENVKYDNLYTVKEVLGNVDTTKGPLQEQIDNIDTSAIGTATDAWLDENVTPSVNAILDTSLTLENYAADAKAAGKLVAINDETDATSTKLHFNTNNQIVNIATMDDVPDMTQIIAPAYSASSTYAVGDHVIYDGKVYECKIAISTAEAWTAAHWTAVKVEGQIEDLKEAVNTTLNPVEWAPNIAKGKYIKFADGAEGSSNKYARTGIFNGYGYRIAVKLTDANYEYAIAYYDATGDINGTGYLGHSEYTSGIQYIPATAIKFGVSFRRVDQTNLSNADVTSILAALSAYTNTDTTLSVIGQAADAKIVGDYIYQYRDTLYQKNDEYSKPDVIRGERINSTTGAASANIKYARTALFSPDKNTAVKMSGSIYEFRVFKYANDGDPTAENTGFEGEITNGFTTDIIIIPSNVHKICISVHRLDDAVLDNSEATAIKAAITFYSLTDKTLTQSGVAADAKETGDVISKILNTNTNVYDALSINDKFPLMWEKDKDGYIDTENNIGASILHSHTKYIDVELLRYVEYKRQGTTNPTTVVSCVVLDKNYNVITYVTALTNQQTIGYLNDLYRLYIPDGGKYARFTFYNDASTYGDFEIYGYSNYAYNLKSIKENITTEGGSRVISINDGGINVNDGKAYESSKYCRIGTLYTTNRKAIKLTNNNYKFILLAYGDNGSVLTGEGFIDRITRTWTSSNEIVLFPPEAKYVAAFFKRTDGNDITSNDKENILSSIEMLLYTDKTLSKENVPSDGKATGIAAGNFFRSLDDVSLVNTFSGVISLYDELVSLYPNYISKNSLTSGSLTNYEYVLTIGNYNSQNGQRGQDAQIVKPTVLFTSGVHGYEQSSVMSLYTIVKSMCENHYKLVDIIDSAIYRIIPVVCPSGYDNDSRVNSNGVNINRNFDTSDWSLLPTGQNYSGAEAGDQDDTKIVQNWINAHNDALFYIDWHNSSYTNEISCLLGLNTSDTIPFKKKYLTAINKIIPFWMKERKIPATNIYGYTGAPTAGYSNTGTSVTYGREHGITKSYVVETSWNVMNSGKHSNFTIGTGAEAFANMLIAFKDFMNDI